MSPSTIRTVPNPSHKYTAREEAQEQRLEPPDEEAQVEANSRGDSSGYLRLPAQMPYKSFEPGYTARGPPLLPWTRICAEADGDEAHAITSSPEVTACSLCVFVCAPPACVLGSRASVCCVLADGKYGFLARVPFLTLIVCYCR